MRENTKLSFLAVCILFIIYPAVVSSHSEHGPYVDFEAPEFWWLEVPCAAEGLGRVKLQDGFGFIDKSGTVVLRGYKDTKGFSEGLAAVADERGRWGYADKTGSVIIPYQFKDAQNFSDGLARVLVNNHWGYIDKSGQLVIPALYDNNSGDFSEGRAYTRTTGQTDLSRLEFTHAIIDKTGKNINTEFFAESFSEGLAYAWNVSNEYVLIDREGRTIPLERKYDWVRPFSEGLAAVGYHGKGGFIDKNGRLVLNLGGILAESFHEGLAPALKGKWWGYIDRKGTFTIKPQFVMAQGFSEGLAPILMNHKWGYIDISGKIVIPPQFNIPGKFSGGLACVELGDRKAAYIDRTGTIVWKGALY